MWRERYGEELAALLLDDFADRQRSLRRDLDVVRAGLGARLVAGGLARGPVRSPAAARAITTAALVGFVASALSIWAQLADGWLTSPRDSVSAPVSFVALTIGLGGLLALSVALLLRLAVAVGRAFRSSGATLLARPLLVLVAGVAGLTVGLRLTSPYWPGARLAHHDGMLAPVARIGWAATETISTFWLHPTRLLTLPTGELAWMVACPVAVTGLVWSLVRLARVSDLRPARLPHVDAATRAAVLLCLIAASAWVVGSQHAADANYRAGTLDLVLIAVMAGVASRWSLLNGLEAGQKVDHFG
ncbi:MAG TPA: hypothetical protein VHZ96_15750 [Frankiaceae bacterium]|nr:hypothetical protein [Frankiaceae bacterium]